MRLYNARFFLGLDLGQAQDPTALTVVERLKAEPLAPPPGPQPYQHPDLPAVAAARTTPRLPSYHGRHLERLPLGTPYPAVVERVRTLMDTEPLKGNAELVVDATGCGRPVFDMFNAAKLNAVGILIHGGDVVSRDGSFWRVPKRDLVGVLQVLLQTERMKFAAGLPEVPTLIRELLNFKVKINPETAHDSYGAWREGEHDDLVLAVAVAAWFAEHGPKPPPRSGYTGMSYTNLR